MVGEGDRAGAWGGGRVTRSLTVGVGSRGLLPSLRGCSWGISVPEPSAIFLRGAPIPRSVCSF